MRKRIFTIKPSHNPGRGHSHYASRNYPTTHPYLYDAYDVHGTVVKILSKRDDYQDNQKIVIDCALLNNGSMFLDHSFPNTPIHTRPSDRNKAIPPGEVNSDVIVMVDTITPKGTLTEITGKIFYVNPQLRGLTEKSLRDAFQDGTKINVLTHVKPYYFHPKTNFIFEKLKDVTFAYNEISAKDGYMPKSP